MPMTDERYLRIKSQVAMWRAQDTRYFDADAAIGMFEEALNVLTELIAANDEQGPTLGARIRSWFRRAH